MSTEAPSVRPVLSLVAGVAALAAAAAAVAAWKEIGGLDPAIARRVVAMAIGAAMIVAGNALPKLLPPPGARRTGRFGVMAPERFAGWTFVLAGILYLGLVTIAPIEYVLPAAALTGLGAFAVAGAHWAWVLFREPLQRPTSDDAPTNGSGESRILELSKQMVLLNLFFACFWVFATFLADSVWGDSASRAMAWVSMIVLVFGNVLLLLFVPGRAGMHRPEA